MLGCLEQQQKNEKAGSSNDSTKKDATIIETKSVGELKREIDCLEKLFNNNNYYYIKQKDTQFVYFTRLNDLSIFTHTYIMSKGDSTQLVVDTIQVNNKNQIIWNWQQQHLVLDSVSNQTSRWINKENLYKIVFNKSTQAELMYLDKSGRAFKMTKTPQISLFLFRSFYDYKKGTHLAFDTSNFTKR